MPYLASEPSASRYQAMFRSSPDHNIGLDLFYKNEGKIYWRSMWQKLGIDLPDDCFSKEARLISKHKEIPDIILHGLSALFFSKPVKDLIEEFEPNVHQFSSPLKVFGQKGQLISDEYYGFNCKQWIDDGVLVDQSLGHKVYDIVDINSPTGYQKMPFPVRVGSRQQSDKVFLDEDKVKGKHLWRAWDYYGSMFFSDELKMEFEKRKLLKLDFYRCPAMKREKFPWDEERKKVEISREQAIKAIGY